MRSRLATALLLLLHSLVLAVSADQAACLTAASCHVAGYGAAESAKQQVTIVPAAVTLGYRPIPRLMPGKPDTQASSAAAAGHAGLAVLSSATSLRGPAATVTGTLAGHGLPASATAAIVPARAPPSQSAETFPHLFPVLSA